MGAVYKSPRVTRPGQSVFIATAAYESVKPGYAHSLALTTAELTRRGIPFEVYLMHGNCHVDDGRNTLVANFLHETQCTDLVFIDADLKWDPAMFMRLISHDVGNIIAGAYPFKSFPQKFPVGKILNARENGFLEVSYAPTGFMRIPRSVFETLIPYQTKRGKEFPTYRFFERRYTECTYDGGDVTFCRKWIATGGKVIVDPKLTLEHIGEYRWTGCFLDYLAKEENRELHTVNHKDPVPEYRPDQMQQILEPEKIPSNHGATPGKPGNDSKLVTAIKALSCGEIKPEYFTTIADHWGNKPWAAADGYLEMAYRMAIHLEAGSHILECGSGASTIVLACAAKARNLHLTTLEHKKEWEETVRQWLDEYQLYTAFPSSSINAETGWYDYIPERSPDLMIIDGPPRYLNGEEARLYPLTQNWAGGTGFLLDDASAEMLETLQQISGEIVPMPLGGRPAAAGRIGKTDQVSVA